MTFVGKILVIAIMAFALLFLGISTVAFTTATNWKTATEEQKKKVATLNTSLSDYQAKLEASKKQLDQAVDAHKTATDIAKKRADSLEAENKRVLDEASAARGELEVNMQNAKTALAEAEARRKETEQLREQKSAVEKQANDYKIQQTELNEKIRELERMNTTLDANTKDLRDRVARYSTLLRKAGLPDDIALVKGLESPPAVEGEVSRVDSLNSRVELTLGSNDGLLPGHELLLYRMAPQAEYLGKVRIVSTDPNQSVAKVIGTTIQGKKIKEGDHVASSFRPRS